MTSAATVARVRVPATSANLGPGFDTLGIALTLYDEVEARATNGGLSLEIEGHGADRLTRDESHLVVRAMRAAFEFLSEEADAPPGLAIRCTNRIPHSRGMGSSAAAIVAGLLLAGTLADGFTDKFFDCDVLRVAGRIEGHLDNVAPCLLGGLTIAWRDEQGGAGALRRDLDPRVTPVLFVPPFTASTEVARGLLPAAVSHADAAFNAARSALLVGALTGAPDSLFEATEDRLHQPFRAPAMAESWQLVSALRAQRHAAVISGAGPSVLVLTGWSGEIDTVRAFTPEGWECHVLGVDADGAQVTRIL